MITVSALAAGSNSYQTTSEQVNGWASDFLTAGVINGGFAVAANGTPNNTVIVGSGIAYLRATPASQASQMLRVNSSATTTVTIAANASGSTVYDWLYISINATNAANPAADGSNVASIVTSRSTSSTSDTGTPPTYGLLLAVVTVANSFSSITSGNITDKRATAQVIIPATSITNSMIPDSTISLSKLNKKVIYATGVSIGNSVPNAWVELTGTFPGGQTMIDSNYSVFVQGYGEFVTGGQGSARIQYGPARALNATQFALWVYTGWTSALPQFVNVIAIHN